MHIVEELLVERAPKLIARPRLFKAIKPILYKLLAYDDAVSFVDSIEPMSGHKAFSMASDHINPNITIVNLENLPSQGRCILIANHPTGLADGMAVHKAIKNRRPDHIFLANADALRVIPHAKDIIIPVEWVKDKRSMAKTRQTLMDVRHALKEEKCVIIFPSGALAQLKWKGLKDRPWESSAAMLAKKYKAPVIPLRIKARNSALYYLFCQISGELRDITLFNELLNKKNKRFDMILGNLIEAEELSKNANEATAFIRNIVENL